MRKVLFYLLASVILTAVLTPSVFAKMRNVHQMEGEIIDVQCLPALAQHSSNFVVMIKFQSGWKIFRVDTSLFIPKGMVVIKYDVLDQGAYEIISIEKK